MTEDLSLLAKDFICSGDEYHLIVDRNNDPRLVGWGNQGAHVHPEIIEWLKANTPKYSISGGGTTVDRQSIMITLKGSRDASLFKMFWL